MDTCSTCYGFGLWAVGHPSPVGPLDAADGITTIPCLECGANANPGDDIQYIRQPMTKRQKTETVYLIEKIEEMLNTLDDMEKSRG